MKKKYFSSFNIAGFTYYDGTIVFSRLKIGTKLKLKRESNNRYDENAVAIYFEENKIGFIPHESNKEISLMLWANANVFEARVQRISPDATPEKQIHVTVFVVKNTQQKKT